MFCYCFLLGLCNESEEYSIWISFRLLAQGQWGSSSVFSGMFIAEVNGVRREGGQEIPEWLTDTLGGLFEHVPDTCLFH